MDLGKLAMPADFGTVASRGAPPPPLDKKHADLKKACQGFESYFLDTLFKEMRKTVPKDKLLGDDAHQEEIFRDMMDQKVADSMSQRGDLGIAAMMYKQLSAGLGDPTGSTAKASEKPVELPAKAPEDLTEIHR